MLIDAILTYVTLKWARKSPHFLCKKVYLEARVDNIAIANKFADLIKPVVDEYGFELIRTEYVKENGNYYLRAYIDKPEGITIDDCVLVSRRASKLLDREDYIEDAYTMEISSPGFMEEPDVKGDTE